jgi:2-oxo-3-hexenedioate decarboxylase
VREAAADAQALAQRLARARVVLRKGGETIDEGVGANVLGSPLHALLHFLNELRNCPGAPDLQSGDIVTTGTWTDAWPVAPGETWSSAFDSVLPGLEVRFR